MQNENRPLVVKSEDWKQYVGQRFVHSKNVFHTAILQGYDVKLKSVKVKTNKGFKVFIEANSFFNNYLLIPEKKTGVTKEEIEKVSR
jgi:hypothetical protein